MLFAFICGLDIASFVSPYRLPNAVTRYLGQDRQPLPSQSEESTSANAPALFLSSLDSAAPAGQPWISSLPFLWRGEQTVS